MTPNEYQAAARETAIYPGQGTFWGLQYAALELTNEAGEVAGVIKKMQRDSEYAASEEMAYIDFRDAATLKKELGDAAWGLAMVCSEAGLTLSEVMEANIAKLSSRKERGVLEGSGDDR